MTLKELFNGYSSNEDLFEILGLKKDIKINKIYQ